MAATTGQLGLVTPTQGTLSGTWGDTVNNGITEYVNIAIAGTLTFNGDGAVTLANTTGSSSATNIGSTTAQYMVVQITGTLTGTKTITGPSYSKIYLVDNTTATYGVTFKASGQTGVTIAAGEKAFVYYNGTDYVKTSSTVSNAAGSTTQVQYNSSGSLAGSANMTFDGTNLTVGGSTTATRFIPSGSTVATNGLYLPTTNTVALSTNSTEAVRISSTGGVGIGATTLTQFGLRVSKTITGNVSSYGVRSDGVVQSDVTSQAFNFNSTASTAAASFTLGQLTHFGATQSTIGAGSSVTNQYGYLAESTLTGATNNYGFYGNIASGTGRWNFYAAGTAANYFGGQIQLNQDYIEKPYSANSSTAITLDLTNGTVQIITLTGNATITMPTAVSGKSFIMLLRQDATGSRTVTWSTVKWAGGTAPTITSTASKQDIYSFFSDGSSWYGVTVGQNYTQ